MALFFILVIAILMFCGLKLVFWAMNLAINLVLLIVSLGQYVAAALGERAADRE